MAEQIPARCAHIASEIEGLEDERLGLRQELADAPPYLQTRIRREMIKVNVELALKRQQLHSCVLQSPPALRPDLVAQTVLLNVNHVTRTLGVAALIKNAGQGNAKGPFKIDMAVTLIRGGITTSFVQAFEVPAGVTIFGEPVVAQSAAAAIPGGLIPSQEYVTERMEVPLHYRDENPSSFYEFEFIVDSDQIVAETNEGNNHFSARWWTSTPAATLRPSPFVVEAVAEAAFV